MTNRIVTDRVGQEQIEALAGALENRIEGTIHTDQISRTLYSTDASMYQMMPAGVLIPKSMGDVQAGIEAANRIGIPVLARGGASSLAGQTVSSGLVIDFTRHLHKIIEINPEEKKVKVQPGLIYSHLNTALSKHGLMVGPDPASGNRATLGGMVGNNSTGTHSILYRSMIDHIDTASVFLADGSDAHFASLNPDEWQAHCKKTGLEGHIYRSLDALIAVEKDVIRKETPQHWRRSSGYRMEWISEAPQPNLAHLICGSEGTLAISKEFSIHLVEKPKKTALGIVHFHDRLESLSAVPTLLETEPSAIELFDKFGIDRCRFVPHLKPKLNFIEGRPAAILIVEYYGETEAELDHKLANLAQTVKSSGLGYAIVEAVHPRDIKNVWDIRKAGLGLIMGVKGAAKPVPFIEDAAVPVEHLHDYIEKVEAILKETNTQSVIYAHASAGCLHVRPFIDTRNPIEVEKMRDISHASMELVREYGGVTSSEHGDGLARSWLNRELLGESLYAVNVAVKRAFDKENQLNPGKIVDADSMTANLRIGPEYETIKFSDNLDFSENGGFIATIELCNGAGVCRKTDAGVMCPSFMATEDEKHSTRGRANTLRAALSGKLDFDDPLTSKEVYEVMELCVECKGCTAECPSSVDMAAIKFEWLGKYWQKNKLPLRDKLFAYMPRLSRQFSGPMAKTINKVNNLPLVRKMLASRLGIGTQRKLPAFVNENFLDWYNKEKRPTAGRRIVLFNDTFNTYHEPEVMIAAYKFLTAIGFSVILPGHRCCGRPMISKGLINETRRAAKETIDILYPFVEEGLPIIGLEPSCVLSFTDEYLRLLPKDKKAQAVAGATFLFEDFVADQAENGKLDKVRWTKSERQVKLHGHCHQKALASTDAALACLTLPPNYSADLIESSCCGMAGSFGYEKEHYDISVKMGELKLAPAIRATSEETIIAASGTSCRSQIEHLTERKAKHTAQVLLDALYS